MTKDNFNNNDLPCGSSRILLPKNVNTNWSVVACDQFTSKPKYWEELNVLVGNMPSALNLILPECYLGKPEEQPKTLRISLKMQEYIASGIFDDERDGYILTTRKTAYGNCRTGLVMQVDLTQYDYKPGSRALIRATEGTVEERIPPRVKIREQCLLELPHIMILIDDLENSVIAAATSAAKSRIYDFDLNMRGGHLTGDFIKAADGKDIENALCQLLCSSVKKYGEPILMAVGDGNHSLASAKECYNRAIARGENAENLKYALVEVVNIYDMGLNFEPIHRVIFEVDSKDFIDKLTNATGKFSNPSKMISGGKQYPLNLPAGAIEGVAFVQKFIDEYLKTNDGYVDYIHGLEELAEHGQRSDAVSIELKAMSKSELFPYIIKSGVLPRKTFSMGEAEEKRYYTEARKIK